MSAPQMLSPGSIIRYAGATWTVLALHGAASVQLRSRSGLGTQAVLIHALLEDLDFAILDDPSSASPEPSDDEDERLPEREGAARRLDEVPSEPRREAFRLEADLLTMLTGTVHTLHAFTGEPVATEQIDAQYDKCRTRKDRYRLLAARRGKSMRQAIRWVQDYQSHGVAGLVDVRYTRASKGVARIDPVVRDCMVAVLDRAGFESKVSNVTLRDRVEDLLEERHERGRAALPPQTTFNEYLRSLKEASQRHLSTKTQRSRKNAPQGVHLVMPVTRPFEYTLWDSTPVDLMTLDPATGKPKRVWLTIVIDLFSRSIVGWLFTANDPTAADMATLMYRVATPKPMLPHWPAHAQWRYPSVPEWIAVEGPHPARGVSNGIAGIPFGAPQTVVIDHGKVFTSLTMREAARILHSNVQLCRVLTPTDKSHVEAAFRRIREQFVERYPGYTGPDVASRGDVAHVEAAAHVFLWELDDDFAEWVACDYQTSTHEGLHLQSASKLELSPNEMLDFGWTRAGFLRLPPHRDLLIDLLPTVWRTVQHYGVEIDGIRYDAPVGQDDVLGPYRGQKSPFASVSDASGKRTDGKWKIKKDPRTNRVWFWTCELDDPSRGRYVPLYYRGWVDAPLFSDKETAYAKAVLVGRGGNARDPEQVMSTLDRILARIRDEQRLPPEERVLSARLAMQTFMVGRDYASAGIDVHTGSASDAVRGPVPARPASSDTAAETAPSASAAAGAESPGVVVPMTSETVVPEADAAAWTYDPAQVARYDTPEEVTVAFWDDAEPDETGDLGGSEDLLSEQDSA